jgi:hypothetical protein
MIGVLFFFLLFLSPVIHSNGLGRVVLLCASPEKSNDRFCPFLLSISDLVLNFYYKDPAVLETFVNGPDYSPLKNIAINYCKENTQSIEVKDPTGREEADILANAKTWCDKKDYLDFRDFIENIYLEEIKFFSYWRYFPTDSHLYLSQALSRVEEILWKKLPLADKARLNRVEWLNDKLQAYLERHIVRKSKSSSFAFDPANILLLFGGVLVVAYLTVSMYLFFMRRRLQQSLG